MRAFHRILVPVDFSLHSAEALVYAADIARSRGASIDILHVMEPREYSLSEGYATSAPERRELDVEAELAAADNQARAAGAVRVATKRVTGKASSAIVALAEEGDYDLIVMGTHGRTGVEHALMGSVAEQVVRNAPCAVLTVRPDRENR
jgi:nucleotide-binding universal stress UspA family protein